MFSLLKKKKTYDVVTFIRISWVTFWQVTSSTYCKSVFRVVNAATSSDVDLCDIDVHLERWISAPYPCYGKTHLHWICFIVFLFMARDMIKSFLTNNWNSLFLKLSISQCCPYCKQYLDEPSIYLIYLVPVLAVE